MEDKFSRAHGVPVLIQIITPVCPHTEDHWHSEVSTRELFYVCIYFYITYFNVHISTGMCHSRLKLQSRNLYLSYGDGEE